MKVEIDGIIRKVQIFPAPRGMFALSDVLSCPVFPTFIAIGPSITDEEKENDSAFTTWIVYCIENGQTIVCKETLFNIANHHHLDILFDEWEANYDTLAEWANDVLAKFEAHGTYITENAKNVLLSTIKNNEYESICKQANR